MCPTIYKRIGRKIKHARRANKHTQEDLGKFLGVSKTAIVNYESAQRKISLEHIVKLCNLYEITVNDLIGLGEIEDKSKEPKLNKFLAAWREEFDDQELSDSEIKLLIEFTRLILKVRSADNGESDDQRQE